MGFMANFKGNGAYAQHARGNNAEALKMYQVAYAEGMDKAKLLLGYAILLIRTGEYEKAVEVLRKAEKAKDLSQAERTQLLAHYAICMWKLGNLERALELLRELYRKKPTGYIYGTLGFLLIESGEGEEALRFNQEAVDYDDEDAVFLDNLAQTYYRLLGDKEKAKPYFERAVQFKPEAIDSNYFLALYDIEAGKTQEAIEKLEISLQGRFSPLNYATPEMVKEALAQIKPEGEPEDES